MRQVCLEMYSDMEALWRFREVCSGLYFATAHIRQIMIANLTIRRCLCGIRLHSQSAHRSIPDITQTTYPQPNTPDNPNIDPGIIRVNIKQGNKGNISFSSFNLIYKTIKITLANVGQPNGSQRKNKPADQTSKPIAPFTAGKHKDKMNSICAILLNNLLKLRS